MCISHETTKDVWAVHQDGSPAHLLAHPLVMSVLDWMNNGKWAQRPLSHMWTHAGVLRCVWVQSLALTKPATNIFFFSLVTLRTEPHVSELICEIKGRKSVSVSGGDHACSLIFLPNRPGSLPGTVRYARSVTSSLWMIHGYKLPPKGMGRGGKALYFRAINLCAFNVVFSHMSKWW